MDDARAHELATAGRLMAVELTIQSLMAIIAEVPRGGSYVRRAKAKWLTKMAEEEKRFGGEEGVALIGAAHASFARMFSTDV